MHMTWMHNSEVEDLTMGCCMTHSIPALLLLFSRKAQLDAWEKKVGLKKGSVSAPNMGHIWCSSDRQTTQDIIPLSAVMYHPLRTYTIHQLMLNCSSYVFIATYALPVLAYLSCFSISLIWKWAKYPNKAFSPTHEIHTTVRYLPP